MTILRQGFGGLRPFVIFLVGATASGKTGLSLRLAEKFPVEIVNADSLQVFRHLDIGTAKPSKKILSKFPHHLIDIVDPDAEFTSKQFRELAEEKLKNIQFRKKIPLFVGGAGFYLKALSNPILDLPAGTRQFENPITAYDELLSRDPPSAAKIHPNDHYRISRALFLLDREILPSQAFDSNTSEPLPFDILWLGIKWDRKLLRDRIQERVNKMFDAGIIEETESVLKDYPESRSRLEKAIGYGECLQFLSQKISRETTMAQTVIHTGQYAKRQETWFRKNPSIIWSDLDSAMENFSISIHPLIQV